MEDQEFSPPSWFVMEVPFSANISPVVIHFRNCGEDPTQEPTVDYYMSGFVSAKAILMSLSTSKKRFRALDLKLLSPQQVADDLVCTASEASQS
ncbi:unnamed protein product [Cyprideis torosa]|uniref:Uncharacterized protein n=1 Tax=Cyprideis torosa TaxID=163714 RepID=A0A7R8ZMQ5_9CRUS|nr:unnamed protein product [Cyprideis torosa]CAG0894536.1 unnamed protein product [Cyprideis torosa]